jgi:hypothetical protein
MKKRTVSSNYTKRQTIRSHAYNGPCVKRETGEHVGHEETSNAYRIERHKTGISHRQQKRARMAILRGEA